VLPDEEIVCELTRLVWRTMLGLDASDRAEPAEGDELTTSVDISGAWVGTVSITCSPALAKHLAATMLACPQDDATAADVRDVIAELTNVVGGNMKGVLPGPSKLSIPRVERGSAPSATGKGSRHWFDCDGQAFSVSVFETSEQQGR